MHANVGLWDVERLGKTFARPVDGLRRRPRGQFVAVPLAHAAVRLERHVRLHLRRVAGLDDVRGGFEAGLEVTRFFGVAGLDVAVLEYLRRAVALCQRHGGNMRQDFVLHLDQPQRIIGLFLGRGGQCGDFLALEQDRRATLQHRHHGLHPWCFLGGAEVYGHDARVRMRRPEDASVQPARTVDVVRYFAWPVTFTGPSRRSIRLPTSVGSAGHGYFSCCCGCDGVLTSGTCGVSATTHPLGVQHGFKHTRIGAAPADVAIKCGLGLFRRR